MHNALRQAPEIQRAARRAFGLGAEDEGLERMGETLDVSADLFQQPDWRWLRGEKLLGRVASAGPVAAQQSYVLINNPLTSGVLMIVDRCKADLNYAVGTINSSAAIVTGGTLDGTGFSRDTRWSPYPLLIQASGQLPMLHGTAAVLGTLTLSQEVLNAVFEAPVVIHPGYAFVVASLSQNVTLTAGILWRERRAFPGELP